MYASARKRKLKNFEGFRRVLAVLQPEDQELKRREYKRTYEDGELHTETQSIKGARRQWH